MAKDLSIKFLFAPIIVSTNVRRLAMSNIAVCELAKQTGNPLFVFYARMQKNILPDKKDFLRLGFYPQKVTSVSARIILTLGAPVVLTTSVGLGEKRVGKGSILHITQLIFNEGTTFKHTKLDEYDVRIPKPSTGVADALLCVLAKVYGREEEVFFPHLGAGIVPLFIQHQKIKLDCLKNSNIQGSAVCYQLPFDLALLTSSNR
jgi:hypothetical protein